MGLTINITPTLPTEAELTATWVGDSNSSGARYLLLTIGDITLPPIVNNEGAAAGNTCNWTYTITGLSPGTEYEWEAVLAWGEISNPTPTTVTASGSFTTDEVAVTDVEPWDWGANDNRFKAFTMMAGTSPWGVFSVDVWNDMVEKVDEVIRAKGMEWSDPYGTKEETKISSGGRMTAKKHNAFLWNVKSIAVDSLTLSYMSSGSQASPSVFLHMMEAVNEAIDNL